MSSRYITHRWLQVVHSLTQSALLVRVRIHEVPSQSKPIPATEVFRQIFFADVPQRNLCCGCRPFALGLRGRKRLFAILEFGKHCRPKGVVGCANFDPGLIFLFKPLWPHLINLNDISVLKETYLCICALNLTSRSLLRTFCSFGFNCLGSSSSPG